MLAVKWQRKSPPSSVFLILTNNKEADDKHLVLLNGFSSFGLAVGRRKRGLCRFALSFQGNCNFIFLHCPLSWLRSVDVSHHLGPWTPITSYSKFQGARHLRLLVATIDFEVASIFGRYNELLCCRITIFRANLLQLWGIHHIVAAEGKPDTSTFG